MDVFAEVIQVADAGVSNVERAVVITEYSLAVISK